MLTLVIGNKNYSSWSLRPWLYMRHGGIAFEERSLALHTPSFAHDVATFDAAGLVPILLDGAIKIWDSLAILDYLAEYEPRADPWPHERAHKAHARAIACEMHSGFRALRMELPQNIRRRALAPRAALSAGCQADVRRVDHIWTRCLQDHGGPFLFGAFSPADAMFAPVAMRFASYAVEVGAEAKRYMHTIGNMPAMIDWIAASEREEERLSYDGL